MLRNLVKSMLAVLLGNAAYFLAIMPHLPPAGRHQRFRLDLGLLIDFWTCLACWGVIEMISRRRKR